MAYEPPFMVYEPFFIGGGGGLLFKKSLASLVETFPELQILSVATPPDSRCEKIGGRKAAQEKKQNSRERRFPGTFRKHVPLILPFFSVFSVGGGPKVPRNKVPGNFFFFS